MTVISFDGLRVIVIFRIIAPKGNIDDIDDEARREREELSRAVEISRAQFERGECVSHHDLMARLKKQLDERTLA